MVLSNVKIIGSTFLIENGYIEISNGVITKISNGSYKGTDKDVVDGKGAVAMPGFIDVHFHGSCGIDFMDAEAKDYKVISEALYKEGITSYLATTLTSDTKSLERVCVAAKEAKKDNPSLLGIHFEGPYINETHKGAQNAAFIRNPDINELKHLNDLSGGNVKYISMAPEKEGSMEFIDYASKHGVVVSAGHTDASFDDVAEAIKHGLTNTTHTHNAMSGHHHRKPGVVTAAMYFDELFTEVICDKIHVCPNTLKAFYKIVGPDRFMIITDALKIKHSSEKKFQLFGLDCIAKDGAAYLTSGPLAGSILEFNQGVKNIKDIVNPPLTDLVKISSTNQARCLHLKDRGDLKEGLLGDVVLMDEQFNVLATYKAGKKVF